MTKKPKAATTSMRARRLFGSPENAGDKQTLAAAYAAMASDEAREAEALEWIEGLVGDVADDLR